MSRLARGTVGIRWERGSGPYLPSFSSLQAPTPLFRTVRQFVLYTQ